MRSRHLPLLALPGLLLWACGGNDNPTNDVTPYMPPAFANPYVDVPYLQEYNHTANEIEPGIGELVSVVLPPQGLAGLDTPTQVTPRGIVRHNGGTLELKTIPEADQNLVAAAAVAGDFLLAGPRCIYRVGANGSLEREEGPADQTISGLVPGKNSIFVLSDKGVRRIVAGQQVRFPDGDSPVLAAVQRGDLLLAANGQGSLDAYELPSDGGKTGPVWTAPLGLGAATVVAMVADVTLPSALNLVVVASDGSLHGFDVGANTVTAVEEPLFAADRVPLLQPRAAVNASDGGFIVATAGGAYRVMDRGMGPEWRVYNAERWVASEDVRAVATDPAVADGPIYFATAAGLSFVTAGRITLEEKMTPFVERIINRHDRDGAVADSHLTARGDLSTNIPWDSDNDGFWTSYWLLAECFRYKVTGSAEAKANFDKSLRAMLNLQDLTGTDYFLARSVIRKEGCKLDDCEDPNDGEWFNSPDGQWWVKGDTSNDEVIAHIFMMGHAHDLCADESQKAEIAGHIDAIVGGIVDHGYQLIDPQDGLCTSYGQFDPYYVNEGVAGRFGDGGVRSVEILAGLNLAYYLTGKQKYLDAKAELIQLHHYDVNTVTEMDYATRGGNGDGDEMGTCGWFTLLRYEGNELLRAQWIDGWRHSYTVIGQQQGAWWDMVNATVGGDGVAEKLPYIVRWLQLAPMDMIRWNQHNSHRQDLAKAPKPYAASGRIRSDGLIIPYDERRCDRWNTDQYRVDGGMGAMVEMDGADVLAPYWMARYYGVIVSQQEASDR